MRRIIILLITFHLSLLTAMAQNPSWAKKAAGAVFTLKTFKADGSLLSSSNGFFIGENGEAVSSYTPFKGAHRAVVIDAQGKELPVAQLAGANEMVDVAKFQVTGKKTTALPLATTASTGSTVWLLPYSAKKEPVCQRGTVDKSEKFQTTYDYYTLTLNAQEQQTSCPVLNAGGEVVGLLQPSATGDGKSYAVSARFVADLHISGLSMNDPALRMTAIPLAIPANYDEALLSLFVASSSMDAQQYRTFVDRFIQQFPQSADGYVYRARIQTANGQFAAADADMQTAVKVADKKDDAHYQYAQLIYQTSLYQDSQVYEPWTLDLALDESRKAYDINPQPFYRQQQAQILYAQQKFAEAYNLYEKLTKGTLRNAENFYAAAQCKLQLDDKKAALMLLDSAVNTFTKPYVKTAVPYLRARAQLSMDVRRFQQAINDMNDIVALEPNNAELWAEKASYELRVKLTNQALESAQECMRLDPQGSDGYLMAGIAQCLKGDKSQGLPNLQKAKELGNSQAQTFIDKYSK